MDIREATITETVRRIWEDSLPSIPFALDKSWSDTGLDSLKALEFVFRLERALGIRVGFDAMTADSTASDLIRLLASEMDKAAQSVDARPQIFLIPGMFGDEPRLGLFRRALNREVKFHTLELPGLEFPSKVHRKIGVTATKLIKDLIRLRPEGDIILCGYSFGGLVAQDMARQLEAKGRQVAFLAVLDGMLLPVTARDDMEVPVNKPDSLAAKMQGGWRFFLDRALFASLLRLNVWEAARRFLLAAAPRHDWSWTNTRGRWLLDRMRSWAVLTWRSSATHAPTLLIASDDFTAYSSIVKWQALCPNITIVPVKATHRRIFEPAPMETIVPAFLEALEAAIARDL